MGNFPKFKPKNWKLSILTEKWHTWYTGGAHSEFRLRFLKFWPQNLFWANLGPKIQSCPFCLKVGAHSISRMLIPNLDLDIWSFDPKIYFWANLGPKFKVVSYVWKLVHIVSQGCWFWMQTQIFTILTPQSIFGQIWVQKFKVVRFVWKLEQMVSQRRWFLFQH